MLEDFPKAKTDDDQAHSLVCRINNAARGHLAVQAYREKWQTFPGILEHVWDHDWNELMRVTHSDGAPSVVEMFRAARYDVSHLPDSMVVYRGGVCCPDYNPGDLASGLAWTRSLPIAAWFATTFYNAKWRLKQPGAVPAVLRAVVQRESILAHFNGRRERELIVDPWMAYQAASIQGQRGVYVMDYADDFQPPPDLVARWRSAAQKHKTR